MRLRQIEDFLVVAECGGIRAAARKLGVSQPSITKSLRSLEVDLGAQLVQRTPQGILLTASGRAFFSRVRVAHAELRKAEEEAAHAATTGATIAFGVGPTVGSLVVPEAVASLRTQFPSIRVRIFEGFGQELAPLVRDGTLDFAVGNRREGEHDSALTFKPLITHQMVVVARKGHSLLSARSLKELACEEWVSLLPPHSEFSPLKRLFAAAGLSVPAHAIQCASYHMLVALRPNVRTGRFNAQVGG